MVSSIKVYMFLWKSCEKKCVKPIVTFSKWFPAHFFHIKPVEPGGAGVAKHPQILSDQLTLSQPRGADYTHQIILASLDFQTFRRPWSWTYKFKFQNLKSNSDWYLYCSNSFALTQLLALSSGMERREVLEYHWSEKELFVA